MTTLPVENLVFVDEAGVNLGMTRRFGRALSGQRAYGTRPQQRGRNVSVIGAIALRGVVASIAIVGATDGLTFEAFIAQRLVPNLWAGACVVMDNASIHQEAFLRPILEQAGATPILLGFWGKGEREKGKKKPLTLTLYPFPQTRFRVKNA